MHTRKSLSLGFVTATASLALATLASAQAPAPFMVHQLKRTFTGGGRRRK